MYAVSNEFKNAIKQPAQKHHLQGYISTGSGNAYFNEENIVSGTFHIQNQCSPNTDLVLGSVYTGTLTATFYGVDVPRNSWIGQTITPQFGLELSNSIEYVPLGIFTVAEAAHTAQGVEVVAYDNMTKFDKKFKAKKFPNAQHMYPYLTTICTACGVTLGMTEEEVEALPNTSTNIGLTGCNGSLKDYGNDLNTYRDLLSWIAQTCVCFATIDRQGRLVLRRFKKEKSSNIVDEISDKYRLAGARFEDYTTNYVAIYVTDTPTGEDVYYGFDEAALRQQIAETTAEINAESEAIAELEDQYEHGQITEEEYREGVALHNRHIKALEKRLVWLNKALSKAQSGDDGVFMDLGENPMLQPDGVGATNTTMRTKILEKVSDISYTPFSCSTVCGVHYDLGDLIRFVGGHATEDGEVCCLMSYDYNFNGEYVMDGYGANPNGANVKPRDEKDIDSAKKSGNKITVSDETPESGKTGDLYIKTSEVISGFTLDYGGNFSEISTETSEDGTTITAVLNNELNEWMYFTVTDLIVNKNYHLLFDFQQDGDPTLVWVTGDGTRPDLANVVTISDSVGSSTDSSRPWYGVTHYGGKYVDLTAQQGRGATLIYDTANHSYDLEFTAVASTMYVVLTLSVYKNGPGWGGVKRNIVWSNIKISDTESGDNTNSLSYYDSESSEWKNLNYVKRVKQVKKSGTKIATVHNNDGTTTDIYAKSVTANPATQEATSFLDKLEVEDTVYQTHETTITPTLQTGTKIADFSVDGATGELYAPTGGGGSGVSTYAELPDKPSINSVVLSSNKTSSDLGIVITLTQAEYDALTQAQKLDENKVYYIIDSTGEIEKLHFDWSHSTLPTAGEDNIVYAIYTGDTPMPYDFYAWNSATQSYIQLQFEFNMADYARIDNLVNLIYPIGSIYMSANNTNPSLLFGGTWIALENKFLLGAGSSYVAGDTGGEATHTLTINEMPSHLHNVVGIAKSEGDMIAMNPQDVIGAEEGSNPSVNSVGATSSLFVTGTAESTGGDQAFNNMPPYLVVYMWKRTA